MIKLGGSRKLNKDSENTAWRYSPFRSYADYVETNDFRKGIDVLKEIPQQKPTGYICSEAVWWSCHCAMISDFLKVHGGTVKHIMGMAKAEEHPYTSPAKIANGRLLCRQVEWEFLF